MLDIVLFFKFLLSFEFSKIIFILEVWCKKICALEEGGSPSALPAPSCGLEASGDVLSGEGEWVASPTLNQPIAAAVCDLPLREATWWVIRGWYWPPLLCCWSLPRPPPHPIAVPSLCSLASTLLAWCHLLSSPNPHQPVIHSLLHLHITFLLYRIASTPEIVFTAVPSLIISSLQPFVCVTVCFITNISSGFLVFL